MFVACIVGGRFDDPTRKRERVRLNLDLLGPVWASKSGPMHRYICTTDACVLLGREGVIEIAWASRAVWNS